MDSSFREFLSEAFDINKSINIIKAYRSKKIKLEYVRTEGNNLVIHVISDEDVYDLQIDMVMKNDSVNRSTALYFIDNDEKEDDTKSTNYFKLFHKIWSSFGELPFPTLKINKKYSERYTKEEGWNKYKRLTFKPIEGWGNKPVYTYEIIVNARKIKPNSSIDNKVYTELSNNSGEDIIQNKKRTPKVKKPTDAPYVKEELIEIGFSEPFVDVLVENESKYANIKKIDHDFVKLLEKKLGLSNVIYFNSDAFFTNINFLLSYAKKDTLLNVKEYFTKKSQAKSKLVLMSKNLYYYGDSSNINFDEISTRTFRKGTGYYKGYDDILVKLYKQEENIKDNSLAANWLKQVVFSRYLETEVDMSLSVFKHIEDGMIKTGDLWFGIGNTRRNQLRSLIDNGWVKEVRDGSTKLLMEPGADTSDINKASVIKDAAKKIKKEFGNTPNRIGYIRGVGINDETVIVYYGFVMPSIRQRTGNGAPTTEYDNRTAEDEKYIIKKAEELAKKYDVDVDTEHVSIFGSMENLVESEKLTLREFLNDK